MSRLFTFPVDPIDFQRFGCEDQNLRALIEGVEPDEDHEDPTRTAQRIERVRGLLDRLPPKERDVFELYFFRRKRQWDIGQILDCTQAAVSYMLHRAIKRIRFYLSVPDIPDAEVLRLLESTPLQRMDIEILMSYRETGQQTATSDALGLTQGRVRHRLLKACARLEGWAEERPELAGVSRFFSALRDHPNIVHRVELPQWRGKGMTVRDERWAGTNKSK